MHAFNPNDDDYSIVVMVENSGFPDGQSLLEFPQVSIAWNVSKSYHIIEDSTTGSKPRITDPNPTRFFGPKPLLPSRDTISEMLNDIDIPFQLDRLRWKMRRSVKQTDPLNSIEDMISNILGAVHRMVDAGQRKKLDVIVTIDKQIRIPHQQYDAMVARRDIEKIVKGYSFMLSRSGLLQQPGDHATSRNIDRERRLAVPLWNEIRSHAAAAGFNINNNVDHNSRGDYSTLDFNEFLMELGINMEALFGGNQASSVFKPASKASIEALEKFIKIDGVDYGTNSEYCVVCLEKMLSGIEVTCLTCTHMFHANCIVQWLKLRHTCPVCRFKLPTD